MKDNVNLNDASSASQAKMILAYMQEGNRITPLEAIELFGCTRLAARISDIEKKLGRAPQRESVQVKNRHGKLVRVTQYWL